MPSSKVPHFCRGPLPTAAETEGLRQDAALLAAWTTKDGKGYAAYVNDGLAMTDWYFAPLDRCAWKRTLGR